MTTRIAVCAVVAMNAQVRQGLVARDDDRSYAVTAKAFTDECRALRRGNALEVIATREPLPENLSARLFPQMQGGARSHDNTLRVGVVIGKAQDAPYVLVVGTDALQLAETSDFLRMTGMPSSKPILWHSKWRVEFQQGC